MLVVLIWLFLRLELLVIFVFVLGLFFGCFGVFVLCDCLVASVAG